MTTPEFSHLVAIDGISPDKTRTLDIAASEEECAALATRFGLRELSDLKATLSLRRVTGGITISVEGKIEADVVQACVVSLRDVPGQVESTFKCYFAEPGKGKRSIDFTSEDEEDLAEIVENGMIDVGEVVAQYLALELDPYPRAPGVSLAAQLAESGVKLKRNPFEVLEGMKESLVRKKPQE